MTLELKVDTKSQLTQEVLGLSKMMEIKNS
jgi:hypothetical protein